MDYQTILPWAIFGLITVMLWALFQMFSSSTNRAVERLEELRTPGKQDLTDNSATAVTVLEKAAPALSKAFEPKSELEQNALKVRLANAGFNNPAAPQMLIAAKVGLGILCTLIGAALGLINWGFNMQGLMAVTITGSIGLFGPNIWLWIVSSSRMNRIFLGLPDALDLLVVCVEAGLGLDAGMRRVAEELEDSHPDVCFEFGMCNMQLQMGKPRKEVLHDLGVRSGVDDMKALGAILIQADKFGSSIAGALRIQSDTMRVKRRQLAEERAQKTSVQMIFPLVLFIFPGVFVVLVGPAAIMMINNLLTD
ncbi:MAG: type II secretion system F family protein [Planctomycetaceae bacterium]